MADKRATWFFIPILLTALVVNPLPVQAEPEGFSLTKQQLLSIAGVAAPVPGTGLRVHLSFGEGATLDGQKIVALDSRIDPTGTLHFDRVITADDVTIPSSPLPDPVVYECADPGFEPSGYSWDQARMPIAWRFRARSIPKRLRRRAVLRDIKRGLAIWPKAATACPQKNDSTLAIVYAGRTRHTVKLDGFNIVEMGRMGSGAVAGTYQWYDGLSIIESDVRLARGAGWATTVRIEPKRHFFVGTGSRAAAEPMVRRRSARRYRKYFVANAIVHEAGNLIGLADLADPHGELSMYALVTRGEKKKLSLGMGDVLGSTLMNP